MVHVVFVGNVAEYECESAWRFICWRNVTQKDFFKNVNFYKKNALVLTYVDSRFVYSINVEFCPHLQQLVLRIPVINPATPGFPENYLGICMALGFQR
jgi:hypothetical protein